MPTSPFVVVPFDKGLTDGDSAFNTGISFPYKEGMTLEDLQKTTLDFFAKEWGYTDADAHTLLIEEDGIEVVGGWVVDATIHDLISDIIVDCGNDSSCYAVNRVQKTQIQKAAIRTIS